MSPYLDSQMNASPVSLVPLTVDLVEGMPLTESTGRNLGHWDLNESDQLLVTAGDV